MSKEADDNVEDCNEIDDEYLKLIGLLFRIKL
jgi:hypothetical protein